MLAQLLALLLRLALLAGAAVGITRLSRFAWHKWGPDPRRRLKAAWIPWKGEPLIQEAIGYRDWMAVRARKRPSPLVEDMFSDTSGLIDCLVELAESRRDLETLEAAQRRLVGAGTVLPDGSADAAHSRTAALTEQMNAIMKELREAYGSLVVSQAPDLAPLHSRLRIHSESLQETTRVVRAVSAVSAAVPLDDGAATDSEDDDDQPSRRNESTPSS
ncbi:MAG: hypothetical protein IV100_01510 [Myxococcales bacterium]|nr:hypothetical protein [Myxococcales bacterium]